MLCSVCGYRQAREREKGLPYSTEFYSVHFTSYNSPDVCLFIGTLQGIARDALCQLGDCAWGHVLRGACSERGAVHLAALRPKSEMSFVLSLRADTLLSFIKLDSPDRPITDATVLRRLRRFIVRLKSLAGVYITYTTAIRTRPRAYTIHTLQRLVSSPAHFRPPFCNDPKRWSGDYGRLSWAWKPVLIT